MKQLKTSAIIGSLVFCSFTTHLHGLRVKQASSPKESKHEQGYEYRKARKMIKHKVKQYIREQEDITARPEVRARWREVRDFVRTQLFDQSDFSEADKLIIKQPQIDSISDQTIEKLKETEIRLRPVKKKIRPRRRRKTKEISITFAKTKVKRMIKKAGIPKADRRRLYKKIMKKIIRKAKVKRSIVKSITKRVIKKYESLELSVEYLKN